jgi:signal transduction histidine kinase
MRNLLLELRPGALEHTPMPELLHQLVDGFSGRSKTDIDLKIEGENPLPFNVRFVFFRIAQEALNNIIKHARATQVTLNYHSLQNLAKMIITDDGKGFDPEELLTGHHGLDIMNERANSINADINISSKVGEGTTIYLNWQP